MSAHGLQSVSEGTEQELGAEITVNDCEERVWSGHGRAAALMNAWWLG